MSWLVWEKEGEGGERRSTARAEKKEGEKELTFDTLFTTPSTSSPLKGFITIAAALLRRTNQLFDFRRATTKIPVEGRFERIPTVGRSKLCLARAVENLAVSVIEDGENFDDVAVAREGKEQKKESEQQRSRRKGERDGRRVGSSRKSCRGGW